MSLVLSAEGERLLLSYITDYGVYGSTFGLRLFVNDYTPVRTTTLANITQMAVANGYDAILAYPNQVQSRAGGNPSTVNFYPQAWTFTGVPSTPNVYGWYMTDRFGNYIGGERFPAGPYVISSAGDKITLDVKFRLKDEVDITGTGLEVLNEGEERFLYNIVDGGGHDYDTIYEFFTNDYQPTDTSVSGNFTICTDTSFRVMYRAPHPSVVAGADRAYSTFSELVAVSATFTGTLYGYRIRGVNTGYIYAAEKFATPIVIANIGETVRVNPVWTLRGGSF